MLRILLGITLEDIAGYHIGGYLLRILLGRIFVKDIAGYHITLEEERVVRQTETVPTQAAH